MFRVSPAFHLPYVAVLLVLFVCVGGLNAQTLFSPVQGFDTGGGNTYGVATADVNGDGKADLLVANACGKGNDCNSGADGSVTVLLGNGDGSFQNPVSYSSGGYSADTVVVADVNADHKLDLLVANDCAPGANCGHGVVGVLLGNGDGTFQAAHIYDTAGQFLISMVVADVNGDGFPDLLSASFVSGGSDCGLIASVLLGKGDGTFLPVHAYSSGACGAHSIAVTDLNNDGKPDLLIASCSSTIATCSQPGVVSVLLGRGDGTFQMAQTFNSGGLGAMAVAAADTDGDGKEDVVVANWCADTRCIRGAVGVLIGNGDGTLKPARTYKAGGSPVAIMAADINQDGKVDIELANICDGQDCINKSNAGVLLGDGDGTFQQVRKFSPGGRAARFVAVGDFDADSLPDLVVANASADSDAPSDGIVGVLSGTTKWPTSTSLQSAPNPSVYGQAVTLTAQASSSGPVPPTGDVTFKNGNSAVGRATLAGDTAVLSKTTLPAGTLTLTATYRGDSISLASTSPPITQIITPAKTTTTLVSSLNPSQQGQTVTFTATVGSPTTKVTGTVTFMAGSTVLGTSTLSSGKAKFATSSLKKGNIKITGRYDGTANISGSSASLTQVVQ